MNEPRRCAAGLAQPLLEWVSVAVENCDGIADCADIRGVPFPAPTERPLVDVDAPLGQRRAARVKLPAESATGLCRPGFVPAGLVKACRELDRAAERTLGLIGGCKPTDARRLAVRLDRYETAIT